MTDRSDLAQKVIDSLQVGIVPWRFPTNRLSCFEPLFGKFFAGEPLTEEEVSYRGLDSIIAASKAPISHHWRTQKPRYDRFPLDRILLPPRSWFLNERSYNACLIHEVLHFLEFRVAWFGPVDQSEMVAEIGTGFIESHLRLPPDDDNVNIFKWLSKWTEGIGKDPAYLFDCVGQAERSVRHLLDLSRRKNVA